MKFQFHRSKQFYLVLNKNQGTTKSSDFEVKLGTRIVKFILKFVQIVVL